jgi:hypothetical protein
MAYFIFLKSLRSLGEFRKNPHVKIPPKSPCANFQSLGIFKNQILFGKEFSPSLSANPAFQPRHSPFFPTGRFSSSPPPLGPTGYLLLPPAPKLSMHGAAGRPRAAPRVDPDTSNERKENGRINPLHSPINRRRFPLITGNRCLQPGH